MNYKLRKILGGILSLAVMVIVMTSCQKEINSGNGQQGDTVTSITLTSSEGTDITVNTEVAFTVKSNNGDVITSESEIFVGDNRLTGNTFEFETEGTYEIYAKYKALTSNRIVFKVSKPNSNNSLTEFTAKILAHDFTATWCGFCAGALLELNQKAKKFSGNVIPIEVHADGSGNANQGPGSFDFPNNKVFKVDGYPTVWHNYDKEYLYFPEKDMESYIAKKAKTGLAINYNLADKKVTVSIKSDTAIKGKKLVVLLLEGELIADQQNYDNNNESSPAYKKGKVIKGFKYNNVARAALSKSVLGDVIADAQGNSHSIVYTLENKIENVKEMKNTKVVAYLLDENDKYINAQVAIAGENKDFD